MSARYPAVIRYIRLEAAATSCLAARDAISAMDARDSAPIETMCQQLDQLTDSIRQVQRAVAEEMGATDA